MEAGGTRGPVGISCSIPHRFIFPTARLGAESQFSDFLDGLGPGQLVGRQTLATPPMGECWGSVLRRAAGLSGMAGAGAACGSAEGRGRP